MPEPLSPPTPLPPAPAAASAVGAGAADLRRLAALLGASATAGFDAGSIGFVLPALREATGASAQQASWLLSVFVAATLLSVPASALATRRWDPVRLLRASLALAVVAGLLGLVLPAPGWVLLARGLLGLAHGPLLPLVAAVVAMHLPVQRQGRLLGLLSMAYGLSFVAATLGTPWLLQLGWRSAFALGAVLAALSLAWPQPAGGPRPVAVPAAPPPWRLVLSRPLQPVVLLALGTGIGQAALVWVPTLGVSRLALPMTEVSPLLVPMLLGGLLATAVVVRSLDRLGARPLALAGGLAAVGGLALAVGLPPAVGWFVAGAAALGLGIGLLSGGPLRYAAARALPREAQGLAQGLVAWITDLGLLGGSLLAGAMAGAAGDARSGVATALGVAAIALALCLPAALRLAPANPEADPR
ncbi:MAG: hypothetical protein RJA10_636 [Pseudomonadota bacterium]|jgi:MFS family permease